MLTISKPTLFSPDGLAARGQCNHDSPGWQLRWFDRQTPPTLVWQGAFKTCRHLQSKCATAESLPAVQTMVEELLNATSFTHFGSQPTDAYPNPNRPEKKDRISGDHGAQRKKRKKKRH
ncbi:MAG: hypothetical protein LIP77_08855 [Planctomycetes bacterium]|nr:hypothetical protein [Planctomycetota bacterium]